MKVFGSCVDIVYFFLGPTDRYNVFHASLHVEVAATNPDYYVIPIPVWVKGIAIPALVMRPWTVGPIETHGVSLTCFLGGAATPNEGSAWNAHDVALTENFIHTRIIVPIL